AAYVTKWTWPVYTNLQYVYNGTDRTGNIASFSAIGPTRDGRQKPDIAAPGQGIASALSSSMDTTGLASIVYPGQKHFIDQGTSMATPHITGASALILGAFPTTTAASIKTLFTTGAVVDAFTGGVPNYTWGYGKLDVLEAMAKKISSSAVVTRNLYAYDGTAANAIVTLTGTTKYAVRISPSVSGQLTGITLNVTTPNNSPIQGVGNINIQAYTNASGLPGTPLGSVVSYPLLHLNPGTPNYIQLLGAGANLTGGTDYQVVLSIANPAETLLFRTENVTTGTRSSTFNGATWAAATSNYRIRAIVTTSSGLSAIGPDESGTPVQFALGKNYPNPFNPSTRINYSIGERGLVTLEIFDILGRQVRTLVNEVEAAGSYQIVWDGKTAESKPVGSGVYFYRLRSGNLSKTERMVLLK
ncbi:MAG TPA: S8 family serine peptidase, partial [Bacteroidota bacterium]|nr:S8 family serine peptidase [Bacteroidota bacterium]